MTPSRTRPGRRRCAWPRATSSGRTMRSWTSGRRSFLASRTGPMVRVAGAVQRSTCLSTDLPDHTSFGPPLSDLTFLDWPFFDAAHRAHAAALGTWCTTRLTAADDHGDVDTRCRGLVTALGN